MKFSLILFNLLFFCNVLIGQTPNQNDGKITKKTVFVGALFNFFTNNNTKTKSSGEMTGAKTNNLGGNITLGYLLSHNLAFLVNLGYNSTATQTLTQDINNKNITLNSKQNGFSISPTIRYYKFVSEGNFFFLQGIFQYSKGKLNDDEYSLKANSINSYDYNVTGYSLFVTPGFTSFISRKLAAEITIGALGFHQLKGSDSKGNQTLDTGFKFLIYQNSINLGLVYYFHNRINNY
jgi:hypothetical protein